MTRCFIVGGGNIVTQMVAEKLAEIGITPERELEAMPFEITDRYENCKPDPANFDDTYKGKCKKLRREARGW